MNHVAPLSAEPGVGGGVISTGYEAFAARRQSCETVKDQPAPPRRKAAAGCCEGAHGVEAKGDEVSALNVDARFGVMSLPRHAGIMVGMKLDDAEPDRRRGYMRMFYWESRNQSRRNKTVLRKWFVQQRVAN